MNKNTIGTTLIILAVMFCLGFFLGRYSKEDKIFRGKDLKELDKNTKKEEAKIDSLVIENHKIDESVTRIHKNKSLIKESYEKNIIRIDTTSFDSLKVLFLRYYPRH
jgi:hypothetical protein